MKAIYELKKTIILKLNTKLSRRLISINITYGEIYSIKNLADFYFPHHFRNLKIAYYHVDTY